MGIIEDYFEKRTYVVAGMGTGQGLSTARLLSKLGSNVFGLSRSGTFPSNDVDKNIKVLKCDIENEAEVRDCLRDIKAQTGFIDGSINNVGTWGPSESKMAKPELLLSFFKLNVMTQYNVIYAISDMLRPGSNMVNVGASRHLFGANHSAYTISKYAIEEMTRITASALKEKGIRVNSVLPGSVGKDDNFSAVFPFNFNAGNRMDPLKIAYASIFLLSPLSGGISGESITVDDGMGL
ncbi:MAG: SDR family oxidoreductase [Candidatus Thermoplasmatota archaeon]|nr:SDR family oxidoreductase [Candidatus Thermoplasmatota archaeon]